MSKTWLQYRNDIRAIVSDITPNDDLFVLAVSEYVKAMISREVDKDITLYKSYWDSYQIMRERLLGYMPQTLFLGTTLDTEVLVMLTVDGEREGIASYIVKQIKNAYQDLGSFSVKVDRMIRNAVIDLQSYISCYRFSQETIYSTSDVVDLGTYSRGRLPDQGEIKQVILIEPVPALIANTFYSYGEHVSSNGRTYVVLRAGSTPADISIGLITTDGSIEIFGSVGFSFYSGSSCVKTPFITLPWSERNVLDRLPMDCGKRRGVPRIAFDPNGHTFYAWPKLTTNVTYQFFWDGIKLDFHDAEIVPLDESSENAVKEWVLSELSLSVDRDRLLSEQHRNRYEMLRSRLFADCSARKHLTYSK